MNDRRKLWMAILAASLVISCTCSLLPFGPDLPQSMRVGSYITVSYPEDWYGSNEYDTGIFAPDYIDLDYFDTSDQPFFFVVPLEVYFGPDWFGELEDADELLDEVAYDLDVELRSTTTVEIGDVRWTKGTFRGSLGEFSGSWEGWIAIELLPRGGAVIIAAAPENEWSDVDNTFDAMLDEIEFAD
ncbi:MAG TPA: hypothetical protein G4O08_06350 [Anaerolineae bacterium]|nr:hypothetical protein [Anaerolineae bacterium]